MSGAWILNQLYTHSLYQKDPAFDEKLKGMFAGALAFFHSSMTAHNGQPVTCPSISPENTFTDNGQRSAVTYMPPWIGKFSTILWRTAERWGWTHLSLTR